MKNKKTPPKKINLSPIEELHLDQAFFKHASDPSLIIDYWGFIIAVNAQLIRASGYSKKELIGKNVFKAKLMTKKSLVPALRMQARVFKGEKPSPFEIEVLLKKGSVMPYEVSLAPIWRKKKLQATLIVMRDLSERKKNEQKLSIYMKAFETSPNSMVIAEYKRGKPRIIKVNKGFTRMYGYSASHALDKSPEILNSGHTEKAVYEEMWTDILNPKKGHWQGEIINKTKKGRFVNVILTISTIFDKESNPLFFTAHHVRIDALKKAEAELQKANEKLEEKVKLRTKELEESESKLSTILSGVPSVIYRCKNEPGWPMYYISSATYELTGYPPKLFLKGGPMKYNEIIHPEDKEKVWKQVQAAVSKKKPYVVRYRIIRADDYVRWVNESGRGIFNQKGELLHLDGVITDVTKEQIIEAAKTEFVSLASHQLRTPLTAIKWFTEAIQDQGGLSDLQEEYLGDLANSNDRMIKLVNDLLNISRLEAGAISIKPKKTSMAPFVQNVIGEVEASISQSVEFENRTRGLKLLVDRDILHQVMLNLLSNASKYSPEKSKITVTLSRAGKKIEISVKNSGTAISKEDQEEMFTKFFRTESAKKVDTKGSGLGLYIVKKMLDACDGSVSLSSTRRAGTVFTISLPVSGAKARKGSKELFLRKVS